MTETPENITALSNRVHELHEAYQAAVRERDEAIRAALEAGRGATELARATGMNRSMIYHIRNAG